MILVYFRALRYNIKTKKRSSMIERFLFVTKQTMNSFINHLIDEIVLKRLRGLYKKSESFLIRFFFEFIYCI